MNGLGIPLSYGAHFHSRERCKFNSSLCLKLLELVCRKMPSLSKAAAALIIFLTALSCKKTLPWRDLPCVWCVPSWAGWQELLWVQRPQVPLSAWPGGCGDTESERVGTRWPRLFSCSVFCLVGGEAVSLLFLLRAAWEVQADLNWEAFRRSRQSSSQGAGCRCAEPQWCWCSRRWSSTNSLVRDRHCCAAICDREGQQWHRPLSCTAQIIFWSLS